LAHLLLDSLHPSSNLAQAQVVREQRALCPLVDLELLPPLLDAANPGLSLLVGLAALRELAGRQ